MGWWVSFGMEHLLPAGEQNDGSETPSPTLYPNRLPLVPLQPRLSWTSDFAVTAPSPRSCWGSPPQAGPPRGRSGGEGNPANCAGKQDFVNEPTPSKKHQILQIS